MARETCRIPADIDRSEQTWLYRDIARGRLNLIGILRSGLNVHVCSVHEMNGLKCEMSHCLISSRIAHPKMKSFLDERRISLFVLSVFWTRSNILNIVCFSTFVGWFICLRATVSGWTIWFPKILFRKPFGATKLVRECLLLLNVANQQDESRVFLSVHKASRYDKIPARKPASSVFRRGFFPLPTMTTATTAMTATDAVELCIKLLRMISVSLLHAGTTPPDACENAES